MDEREGGEKRRGKGREGEEKKGWMKGKGRGGKERMEEREGKGG